MEERLSRVHPSDGISRELGSAVAGAFQRPDLQHAAQRLSRSGGTAAFQALASYGYGLVQTPRKYVSRYASLTKKNCTKMVVNGQNLMQ